MIDLLDLVRSIAAAAERAAENKNYPVPCGQSSPLLDIVRQACVERGYTAGGLAVAGVTIAAQLVEADERQAFEKLAKRHDWDLTQAHGDGDTRWLSPMTRDLYLAFLEGRAALAAAPVRAQEPVDMLLYCPACGMQHIDAAEGADWTNPPHRSHLCHSCKHVWRPADVPTNGVARVKTSGAKDIAPTQPVAKPDDVAKLRRERDTLAQSIADAALKAGIWNGEVPLSGPHLLMMVNDMAECIAAPAAQGDAKDAERLAIEEKAQEIYSTWQSLPEFVAWQHGGNSHMQERARDMARVAITTKAAS